MNESNGSSGRSATDRSGSGAVVGTFEALHGEAVVPVEAPLQKDGRFFRN
ncbi:hypothetical protein GS421_14545 [Rhodococcus hoagii]|nr:hypothetical protein [Prescottella equi]